VSRLVLALITLVVGALILFVALPSDVVTFQYAKLQAARENDLFKRGWLPDILPPSTYKIRVSNDLDRNTSEGFFSFESSEYSLFKAHLRPYQDLDTPYVGFDETIKRARSEGFETFVYKNSDSTWLISCKDTEGYCKYIMWLRIK